MHDFWLCFQLLANRDTKATNPKAPYIAAKFPQRNIPYTFHLGSGDVYDGFTNKRLERGIHYRIFVRAVVDTPEKVSYVYLHDIELHILIWFL